MKKHEMNPEGLELGGFYIWSRMDFVGEWNLDVVQVSDDMSAINVMGDQKDSWYFEDNLIGHLLGPIEELKDE